MKATERLIKKYPNRRLYDTVLSRYITLDSLKELIIEGVEWKAIDIRTKKDITHSILLQIIAEEEEKGSSILTAQLLRQLIRFYGNKPERTVLGQYLEQCLFFFLEQQPQITNRVNELLTTLPKLKIWKGIYQRLHEEFKV